MWPVRVRDRKWEKRAENDFSTVRKKKSSATAAIPATNKTNNITQLALFFPLYYTHFHSVCCFIFDGMVCFFLHLFFPVGYCEYNDDDEYARERKKNRFIPSFIFECANFSMVRRKSHILWPSLCYMFMCSICRYTLAVSLCKHFDLCALCYRALYRCHCTAHIDVTK